VGVRFILMLESEGVDFEELELTAESSRDESQSTGSVSPKVVIPARIDKVSVGKVVVSLDPSMSHLPAGRHKLTIELRDVRANRVCFRDDSVSLTVLE
jgi:hypothetical protein